MLRAEKNEDNTYTLNSIEQKVYLDKKLLTQCKNLYGANCTQEWLNPYIKSTVKRQFDREIKRLNDFKTETTELTVADIGDLI